MARERPTLGTPKYLSDISTRNSLKIRDPMEDAQQEQRRNRCSYFALMRPDLKEPRLRKYLHFALSLSALEHFLAPSVSGGMKRHENPNWQDKLLGGAILTGFVVVAVIAVLFTLVKWTSDRYTASSTTVGSSTHASGPAPHSTN